jgi:cob(I)alamin adenosyltransferase
MVRIDRVITRGGDGGETSLGDGTRIGKASLRVEAIGAVDEANAVIGLLRVAAPAADAMLAPVQNDLFDLGADLSVPGEAGDRLRMTDVPVVRLEAEVLAMNATLPPLRSFVLPGGTEAAARAHHARTMVRAAERAVVRLLAQEVINPSVVRYLNRLSDHLFVLARVLNSKGSGDVLWVPGAGLSDHQEARPQEDAGQSEPERR